MQFYSAVQKCETLLIFFFALLVFIILAIKKKNNNKTRVQNEIMIILSHE